MRLTHGGLVVAHAMWMRFCSEPAMELEGQKMLATIP
jgi:hypothetical protein